MSFVEWGSGWRSVSLSPSARMRPIATKKIGVEMTAARAEIIPHANIAARTSESAAMSMPSFHTVSRAVVCHARMFNLVGIMD